MTDKPKEPPYRIANDRKVFDVTTTTDAVRRPVKVGGQDAHPTGQDARPTEEKK